MRKMALNLCILMIFALVAGCASSDGGKKAFFDTFDADSDGKITRDEYNRAFDNIDYNGNEILDDPEIGSVLSGH